METVQSKDDEIVVVLKADGYKYREIMSLKTVCENVLSDYSKNATVIVNKHNPNMTQKNKKTSIQGVRKIISVVSGKGGVGKSTCAVNIALSIANSGFRVAIVDADVYGPSVPTMLGVDNSIAKQEDGRIYPIKAMGLYCISMGFVVNDIEKATIWRGPITTKALKSMLLNTAWEDIDYMIIDTPPGTGDVHLSLAENFVIDGAILISTSHIFSVLETSKSLDMLRKFNIKSLGIIENMSYMVDKKTGDKIDLFSNRTGVDDMAEKHDLKLLGKIPFDIELSKVIDETGSSLSYYVDMVKEVLSDT